MRNFTEMNVKIPLTILPSLLFVVMCVLPTVIILWINKRHTARKRSPLTTDMLRSPGESLNEQIKDISDDIVFNLFMIPMLSIVLYSAFLTQYFSSGKQLNILLLFLYTATLVVGSAFLIKKISKLMKHRNQLRLGYDCELAVGQELTERIRDGFHLFHDFPADGFNIDHILVGPTGVFAIETKGRAKSRVAEKENWKLDYDGNKLIFPEWTETKPLQQAKSQAKWLSGWLSKTTGISLNVAPVLAIPGWWINRTAPGGMAVYNGKNSGFLAKGNVVLASQQIKSVVHQIDQKCRTIESSSYKQESSNR